MAIYKQNSMYAKTPINSVSLGIFDPPDVEVTGNEQTITISRKFKHRPDLLSYSLYGTSRLWWIFKMMNPDKLNDPIWDFNEGVQIIAPTKAEVGSYIS